MTMRYGFSVLIWLLIGSAAFASHLIGGYIQATPVAGRALTYQVTATLYFSANGAAAVSQMTSVALCFGDNSTAQQAPRLTLVPLPTDRASSVGTFSIIHTYSGPGVYTITTAQINRTPTRNNASADQALALQTTLQVGVQSNQMPTLPLPAAGLTFGNRRQVEVSLAGIDLDGDSLSYALATPLTGVAAGADACYRITPLPAYQYPNAIVRVGTYRLNARTGQLLWNAPSEVGLYTIAVTVLEWRAGVLLSQTLHELILTVVDQGGTPATPPPYEPAQSDLITALPEPDYAGLHLTVSPNPVVDLVRVRLTNDHRQPARLLLLDSQGRTRQTISVAPGSGLQQYEFDVSQYPAGTYLIRAESNGQQVVSKIVKP